ncbi:MAG: preprotein translocase subunit SecG [Endomicrobium sp.]|nr:preprotein translocase subunit SecG [Endomicrobium sp.]
MGLSVAFFQFAFSKIFLYNFQTMNIIYALFQAVHYFVCAGLIIVVLLQAGKSGGMAGIFGGGGSDQIFNAPSGMAFIKKLTIAMAVIFMITSVLLTRISTRMNMMSIMTMDRLSNIPSAQVPVSIPSLPQEPSEASSEAQK